MAAKSVRVKKTAETKVEKPLGKRQPLLIAGRILMALSTCKKVMVSGAT